MRTWTLALAALAALALLPAASARAPLPTGEPFYDVDLIVSPDECQDCVTVDAVAGLSEPPGCADCGGIGAHAGLRHDAEGTTVTVQVCRGGIVYLCPVDIEETL